MLTDLAMVAVQRRDLDQLVMYADAALDTARQPAPVSLAAGCSGFKPT